MCEHFLSSFSLPLQGERGPPMPREAWGGGPMPSQYRGRPPQMGMDGVRIENIAYIV